MRRDHAIRAVRDRASSRMIRLTAFLLSLLWLSAPAPTLAQTTYPDRPIRIINPFPSGSPIDVIGRLVADRLEKAWGQPVLVESKSGAGGTVGANFVAKSPPDGYTLPVTSTPAMVRDTARNNSCRYDTAVARDA